MKDDMRGSFRLEEAVRLDVKLLDDEQWQLRLARSKDAPVGFETVRSDVEALSQDITRKLMDVRQVSQSVAACLDLLNRKLDAVMHHVAALENANAEIDARPLRICELSASGIRYPTSRSLQVGDKLRMRISIVSARLYFEVLGQVVRAEPASEDGAKTVVAVEFHGMREADQDLLVRHLLGRQAQTLRARRIDPSAAPTSMSDPDG